jgi:hypothetical protein
MDTQPLLGTLLPELQRAIVERSCSDMHNGGDADAAAYAQDTAAALRLACRALRAAVDATIRHMDMRATTAAEVQRASERFPGTQYDFLVTGCQSVDVHDHSAVIADLQSIMLPVTSRFVGLARVHLRMPRIESTVLISEAQMPCLFAMRCGDAEFHTDSSTDWSAPVPVPLHSTTNPATRAVHAGSRQTACATVLAKWTCSMWRAN